MLNLLYGVIVLLASITPAASQSVTFYIDRSSSVFNIEDIDHTLHQLGDTFIEAVPWNCSEPAGAMNRLTGTASQVVDSLPKPAYGTCFIDAIPNPTEELVACQTFVIIVHGLADQLASSKLKLQDVLSQRARVIVLVVETQNYEPTAQNASKRVIVQYSKLVRHENYRVDFFSLTTVKQALKTESLPIGCEAVS